MRCCLTSSGSGAAGTGLNVLSSRGDRTGGLYFRKARGIVSAGGFMRCSRDYGLTGKPRRSPARRRPSTFPVEREASRALPRCCRNRSRRRRMGTQSARCKSRPSRSRIVLLYSARLRRRTATRPAAVVSVTSAASSQELMVSSSSRSGAVLLPAACSAFAGCRPRAAGVIDPWDPETRRESHQGQRVPLPRRRRGSSGNNARSEARHLWSRSARTPGARYRPATKSTSSACTGDAIAFGRLAWSHRNE